MGCLQRQAPSSTSSNQLAPNSLRNLPARSKMVTPNFKMLWAENIPLHQIQGEIGGVEIRCIVGSPGEEFPQSSPTPPNDSWASAPNSDLAIWTIKLSPYAKWTLPPASGSGTRRQLFYFMGEDMLMAGIRFTR